ncbi:MAG: ATP-binding protein [Micrococcales bacterium]|nr:ATP-binding protein [Micrococcales bacterium]
MTGLQQTEENDASERAVSPVVDVEVRLSGHHDSEAPADKWLPEADNSAASRLVRTEPHFVPRDLGKASGVELRRLSTWEPQPHFSVALGFAAERAVASLKDRTGIELDSHTLSIDAGNTLRWKPSEFFPDSLQVPDELREGLHLWSEAKMILVLRRIYKPLLVLLVFATAAVLLGIFLTDWPLAVFGRRWSLVSSALVMIPLDVAGLLVIWRLVYSNSASLRDKIVQYDTRRAAFNKLLFDGLDALISSCLRHTLGAANMLQIPARAPKLVETNSRGLHGTRLCSDVGGLMLEHESIAIGIVGQRGVGKTSILEILRDQAEAAGHLAVFLPVPAVYSEESFLRALALRIAARLAGVERSSAKLSYQAMPIRSRALLLAGIVAMYIAALLGFAGVYWSDRIQEYTNLATTTAALLVGLSVMLASRSIVVRGRVRRAFRGEGASRTARLLYQDLRYVWEGTEEVGWSVKPRVVETRRSRSRTWRGKELSYVEVADRLRSLLEENAQDEQGTDITILIDELDKLPEQKQQTSLINVLKDLFHLRRVRVVVTVAPEAHDSFARRQSAADRTVYDTAFDEIVEVKEMTSSDAVSILRGRVPEFPDGLALFCHCVAAGNPRDMIRVARRLLKARRRAERDFSLESVLREVISESWSMPRATYSHIESELVELVLSQVNASGEWNANPDQSVFLASDRLTDGVRRLMRESSTSQSPMTA